MRLVPLMLGIALATPAFAEDFADDFRPAIDPALEARIPDHFRHILEQSPLQPIPLYLNVDEDEAATNTVSTMAAVGDPLVIYMNRWGGTFVGGPNNSATNTSSIVQGTANVTPFGGTDGQWNEVRTCVQDLFSRFNLVVTDVEPTSGNYVEAVVAGSPNQIGMPWGVGGVAPYDPYDCDVFPTGIVYAFSDVYINPGNGGERALCETTAQEIAHAFGLDHELLCADPMTYLDGCGAKEFQDVYAPCGEFEERACSCNRSTQNSVAEMFEKLGASNGAEPPPPPNDLEDPTIDLITPEDGETFVGGDWVNIVANVTDDIGLVQVSMYWEFNDIALACPGSGDGWNCERDGDTYTWQVRGDLGERRFQITARDVMGKTAQTDMIGIQFSPDGEPLPEDAHVPEVRIVTPADGSVLPANTPMQIVVTASDDLGINQTALAWEYSGRYFPCPFEGRNVSCVQNGETYVWTVNVGEGSRRFWAVTQDWFGKLRETPARTVTLSNSAQLPPPVENDTYDFADELECGDVVAVDVSLGSEDWFAVNDVPEGHEVEVVVTGDLEDDVVLDAATGEHSALVVAEGDSALVLEPEAVTDDVRVRVRTSAGSGAAQLEVRCLEPVIEENPVKTGCSAFSVDQESAPAALALLFVALIPFSRRRQRR
jgi:MYXO-CTERM domain-containing protein